MLTIAAVICAAAATLLVTGPPPATVRLARVLGGTAGRGSQHPADRGALAGSDAGDRRPARSSFRSSPRARIFAALLAGAGTAVVVGGGVGLAVAAVAGIGAWFGLGRLEPAALARHREQSAAMLPLATDLLAAALAAGCPPVDAVEQVGRAMGGPLGQTLVRAATTARVGIDPARAWSVLTGDPVLRPLGRVLTSATVRGTSPTVTLQRAAHDAREAARWKAESRARALGARAAAPLGLCFLPAFILLGIVPVVVTSGLMLP